ncbi:hypothetical protein BDQ12DRAFT_450124 [Crucibulum laeve]|uniref:Uncharacterized protein n=1 Tax=Crucibulum laeve TaxID=68775 RepID=A0A5C3LW74_9AGAR|nr:hypothetical protein BDQ12DRAFT_450124 [Crucibulum laeve]
MCILRRRRRKEVHEIIDNHTILSAEWLSLPKLNIPLPFTTLEPSKTSTNVSILTIFHKYYFNSLCLGVYNDGASFIANWRCQLELSFFIKGSP